MQRLPASNPPVQSNELDSQRLFKWLIIAGVLAVSVYFAQRASSTYLMGVLAVIGGLILLRWSKLGLPVLLVSTLAVPVSFATGSQTPLNITVLLIPTLLGIWFLEMLQQHNVQLAPSRVNLPLLALLVAATLSLIAGSLPWNLFAGTAPLITQVAGWAVFAFSIGIVLLVGNHVHDQRMLQLLVVLFFIIGAGYMAGRLRVPILSELSRMMNRQGSDGSVFWVWLTALATGQLLFNQTLHRWKQLFLLGLIGVTLYIGFFQARDWASGWLPPLAAIGVIIWLRSWRVGVMCALIGIIVLFVARPDILQGILSAETSTESYSILTRDAARDILLQQIFPLSPIFGLGPANYYWYTPLYPILGWYVKFNSHNNYVDILMQTGIIGLLCFLWVMGELGWLGWRLRNRFKGDFAQGYVNACVGGIVGTLLACWLADWLLPFVYNIGLTGFRASILAWIFMGGLVSLEQIARRADTAPKIISEGETE
jgi:hypothetical protein